MQPASARVKIVRLTFVALACSDLSSAGRAGFRWVADAARRRAMMARWRCRRLLSSSLSLSSMPRAALRKERVCEGHRTGVSSRREVQVLYEDARQELSSGSSGRVNGFAGTSDHYRRLHRCVCDHTVTKQSTQSKHGANTQR